MQFLLIILMGIGVLLGIFKYRNIYNPISLFNLVWLIVISLHSLKLSYLQTDLSSKAVMIFIYAIISFDFGFMYTSIFKGAYRKLKNKKNIDNFKDVIINKNTIIKMFIFWLIISVFEVVYMEGVPILWKIMHVNKGYMDFGIPSLHGFINALGLTINILAYNYLLRKDKKDISCKLIIFAIMFFYIIILSRQVIMSALLEMIVLKFLTTKSNGKKINYFKYLMGTFILVVFFGVIGNYRTGSENFYKVALMKKSYPKILDGFIWCYIYITMGIDNINKMSLCITPNYNIVNYIKKLLPTVLSKYISTNKSSLISSKDILVKSNFTVSGYFADIYIDIGLVGVIILSVIYGIVGAVLWSKFKEKNDSKNALYYIVYIHIIMLSFFVNFLAYLPIIFQIVLIMIIYKKKLYNKEL